MKPMNQVAISSNRRITRRDFVRSAARATLIASLFPTIIPASAV
jgi:hypothetical protein